MKKIKEIIKRKIDFLKKVDEKIGLWVTKVPMLLFDFLIIALMTVSFLWGVIVMIIHSLGWGIFIVLFFYIISIYLIFKKHKKLNELINKY